MNKEMPDERAKRCYDMRQSGAKWADIATAFGVSVSRAQQLCNRHKLLLKHGVEPGDLSQEERDFYFLNKRLFRTGIWLANNGHMTRPITPRKTVSAIFRHASIFDDETRSDAIKFIGVPGQINLREKDSISKMISFLELIGYSVTESKENA